MQINGQRDEPIPGRDRWSEQRAEDALRSLELFGMRFGLDRMRRMMTALGSPERAFPTIQVLGTNGKSSTTRMAAAILQRHGLRTGAYTSPHLVAYRERVLIEERELSPSEFSAAVARADRAARQVNRTLQEDDHVTQFELLTAAALWEMARRGVEVGVVEAGLGGRYDATSVVAPGVAVLTNVGLEHTRWLGPTIADIAEEKLAVVQPGATLVLGEGLAPPALAVAERVAAERGAEIVFPEPLPERIELRSRGTFQRRNLALAAAAAAAHLRRSGRVLEVAGAARRCRCRRGSRAAAGARRRAADGARRRPQPRRRGGAGRVPARSLRHRARARARRARGQGRRRHAAPAAAPLPPRVVHRAAGPARAAPGRAALAGAPARLRGHGLRAARELARSRQLASGRWSTARACSSRARCT